MREAKDILENLNNLSEKKVTFADVMDAKKRFEEQVKETTWLIHRVSVYGSKELQQRAYDNVTAQLKAMDSFLEELYNESIGE
jgi:predicted RNA-binding protein